MPEKATCPCCGERRFLYPHETPLREEAALARAKSEPHWASEPGWSARLAVMGKLVWACCECQSKHRAVVANATRQTFCCDPPRFAYFDMAKTCRTCSALFVFSAKEQRLWFETYSLPVFADPLDCLPCRRAKRRRARANDELAAALKRMKPDDPKSLVQIARLYLAAGSAKKAATFLRRAKNLADTPEQAQVWLEEAVRLEARSEEAEGSALS